MPRPMRRGLLFVVNLILLDFLAAAQSIDQKASDAWLISRMVEKFHVEPRPLTKDMSAAIFDRMLDEFDGQHLIFTTADIRQLSAYRLTLDDEILNKRTGFLTLLSGLYRQRLMETDSIVDIIAAKPFTFS